MVNIAEDESVGYRVTVSVVLAVNRIQNAHSIFNDVNCYKTLVFSSFRRSDFLAVAGKLASLPTSFKNVFCVAVSRHSKYFTTRLLSSFASEFA